MERTESRNNPRTENRVNDYSHCAIIPAETKGIIDEGILVPSRRQDKNIQYSVGWFRAIPIPSSERGAHRIWLILSLLTGLSNDEPCASVPSATVEVPGWSIAGCGPRFCHPAEFQ